MFEHKLRIETKDGEIRYYDEPGLRILAELYINTPQILKGAYIRDIIVGKGAASIMSVCGVSKVDAKVITRSAVDILLSSGIKVNPFLIVPVIWNRKNTGICPVEDACKECTDIKKCADIAAETVKRISGKKKKKKN